MFSTAVALLTASVIGITPLVQRTNFSGAWAEVPGASIPKELRTGGSITVKQTDSEIFIELRWAERPPDAHTYRLDGTETKYQEDSRDGSREVNAKATWDGAKLVVTEWIGTMNKREITYSLDQAGRLVIVRVDDRLGDTSKGMKMLRIATTRVYQKPPVK